MRWGRSAAAFAVLSMCVGCVSASRRGVGQLVRYNPGQSILIPAKVGTTESVLGVGFTTDFNDRNSRGGELRLYPPELEESTSYDYDKYDARIEMLDDQLKIRGHVSYLFFDAGITYQEDQWYARYSIYRVMRVKKLVRRNPPMAQTDLVATAIYYGWSLNYVIQGDLDSFGGDLGVYVGLFGAGLKAEIEKRRLKTSLSVVGLKPKKPNEVVLAFTPEDVRAHFFEPERTDAVPIFVEYSPVKSFAVPQPPLYQMPFREGAYTISHFHLTIAPKNNGKKWDQFSDLPDPEVKLMVDGQLVGTCGWLNESMEPDCEKYFHGKRIRVKPSSVISFAVRDMDGDEEWEDVGGGAVRGFFTRSRPNAPIDFDTDPNIVKAKIILSPAR